MKSKHLRFWEKVAQGPNGCWNWAAGTNRTGYGYFYNPNGSQRPHRVAWEEVNGPIPDGLEIDHFQCNNRLCVNPSHMRVVTHTQNMYRRNGRPGEYARATHCFRGHEFTEGNLDIYQKGSRIMRQCAICKREVQRAYYLRNRQRKIDAAAAYNKRNKDKINAQARIRYARQK